MDRKDIKKLDGLWALTVKEKAKYKCEHCGSLGRMEAAHVVGRRHRATRWGCYLEKYKGSAEPGFTLEYYDLCGHCLCHVCHQHYDEHGPKESDIVRYTVGKERKQRIQDMATMKVTKGQFFEDIEETLKKERTAVDDSPFAGE